MVRHRLSPRRTGSTKRGPLGWRGSPALPEGFLRRILLGAGLGLSILVAAPLSAAELTPFQRLGRDLFQELIETDTTHSTGDTTPAALALARRFRSAGFPEVDVQVIGPNPRNQNLVVRYRGSGARAPVVLLAHLDVVEAKRSDWSLDPFKLTERDGFFYGRGTSDNKDGAAQLSAVLLRLRQEGFKPDRDLVLALTAGEEGAPDYNGVQWLLQSHRELVNGAVCLNVDAGGLQQRRGQSLMFTVQTAEKVYLSFRLEATSPGGHSSLPTRDNPIYRLAEGLVRLSRYEFPVRLNETTRGYLAKMAEIETGPTAADLKAILRTPPDPEALARLSADPVHNATLRTTAVATLLEGGHAENALPQRAQATVNCRLLPDESPDTVLATLRQVLADDRISVTPLKSVQPSPASPLTPVILDAIEQAKNTVWPGIPLVPQMESGATDGLFFRQQGIPTYGVGGTPSDLDDIRAHGRDERIGVQGFYAGLEFEYQLVRSVARGAR
jgi:acetylornithine deacetylase/succinyl-diaminopimelate desuccinylase-like protein